MSYMLPHLHNGWQVDQAILSEEDRVVVIRFGHDWDPTCMKMDEVLYSIAEKFCRLYRKCGTGICFWGGLRTFQSWQKAKGNRHVAR
ncbi:TXNL4A isoform 8 [Pan troglodytes]|uniref:Thioredoxin like 4A n=2 Tax=Homininae TaxID=207598 RepID=K7EMX5_HUMAN|nr:thioredoxin like 4A [Homo sapiens]KAI4046840.1 thioredoxin like 4A [Homo sapiens]PNI19233.1 TXNL4A isoform 8 [Pan troglodytes]